MSPRKQTGRNASLRIISGRWRGRRIAVPADGIRPTGDRVRETLFNWLAPYLPDARCLDLFAGSGVLGIEALSRGAPYTLFVEKNRVAAGAIREVLAKFAGDGPAPDAEVLIHNALQVNLAASGPFSIVFLDPPFDGPPLEDLCTLLQRPGVLQPTALIYMEMDRRNAPPQLPRNWEVIRDQTAGQVRFALIRVNDGAATKE